MIDLTAGFAIVLKMVLIIILTRVKYVNSSLQWLVQKKNERKKKVLSLRQKLLLFQNYILVKFRI